MLDTSIFTLRYFLRRSLFLRHPICYTLYIYNWYAFTRLVQVYKFWKQNAWFFISVIHYLVIHYLVFITLSLFCPLLWTRDELFQESGSLTPLCMYSCVINVSACQTNIFYRNIYHPFYAVLLFNNPLIYSVNNFFWYRLEQQATLYDCQRWMVYYFAGEGQFYVIISRIYTMENTNSFFISR